MRHVFSPKTARSKGGSKTSRFQLQKFCLRNELKLLQLKSLLKSVESKLQVELFSAFWAVAVRFLGRLFDLAEFTSRDPSVQRNGPNCTGRYSALQTLTS